MDSLAGIGCLPIVLLLATRNSLCLGKSFDFEESYISSNSCILGISRTEEGVYNGTKDLILSTVILLKAV
jgi:hypothetical protein